jgi:hypothetical protein
MKPAVPKPQRCAIYTRKSTEHRPYPKEWERRFELGDGAKLLVRPIPSIG